MNTGFFASQAPSDNLGLAALPDDLLRVIAQHLDHPETQRISSQQRVRQQMTLSEVNRRFFQLFREEAQLNLLLQATVRADQALVERILAAHPQLVLAKGNVLDNAGRYFPAISALQYAAWALDIVLLQVMLGFLNSEHQLNQAHQQLQALHTGYRAQGPVFRLSDLSGALQTLSRDYDLMSDENRQRVWIQMIGGLQREVPVHVAQEYCRLDRAFYPTPAFAVEPFSRSTHCFLRSAGKYEAWFEPSGPNHGLGQTFAIARGGWIAPPNLQGIAKQEYGAIAYAEPPGKFTLQADARALVALWGRRLQQLLQIRRTLLMPRHAVNPAHTCMG